MSSLIDHYKVLGVNAGAGIADVTTSYKRLCRIYHPDINSDPESEEQMKRINIAYTVLREKFRREAAFRERQAYSGPTRRYQTGPDARPDSGREGARKSSAEEEKEAFAALQSYFVAINSGDYTSAYTFLSGYDKRYITRDSFIDWRRAVARLYPMRGFTISGGQPGVTMTFGDNKTYLARKFRVMVKEEDVAGERMQSGEVEKMAILENNVWKVFLGYKGVVELTRSFDERFEAKRKRDLDRHWDEYLAGLCPEYDMLSLTGMRKAVLREIYRQKRFGGALTFAVISVKTGSLRGAGQEELLRSAARTVTGALRETDVSAYGGDGIFAVLYVELRKRNAAEIVKRLLTKIRRNAGLQLGEKANIDYAYETWAGSKVADFDSMNRILKKFDKKM